MNKDKYKNFGDLFSAEGSNSFDIEFRNSNSRFLIFSPHGGGIEQGTSEICKQIAGKTHSYYLFTGIGYNCKRLHITSTNFDEPELIRLLSQHTYAVSIHGMTGKIKNIGFADIYLGGLNGKLIEITTNMLRSQSFSTTNTLEKPDLQLSGKDPRNITNKCISGQGMQVEISEELRAKFFRKDFKKKANRETGRTQEFYRFCDAIVQSINQFENELINTD
jgi:phage replication-related protein YjqB (UPF0714/DUF867 family)